MDTDHETDINERFPPDAADADDEEEDRGGEAEEPASTPKRPRSRPDLGCLAGAAVLLAIILFFGWVIIGAIVDVAKESREREIRRKQNLYSYHSSAKRASSGGSSPGSSSGGSSSYGSSGSAYRQKSAGGGKKDEYNAADFGNPEDFYDEHYDDFFDYYDAEDYWNEHN